MEAASSATGFSYTKEYEVGAGTIDQGRDYEFKMVVLISLRCVLQDFDDMWIAFNAAGLGALDDVVVNAHRKDGNNMKILLQLKHEEKGKDIAKGQFLSPNGNFSLLKYCDHIVKLKQCLDCKSEQKGIIKDLGTFDNMYFVLFTNKGTNKYEFLEDGGCDAISFLNTAINNDKLYRFDLKKVPTLSSLSDLDYSTNFCLFAKQRHANHLDELIETEIKNVIRHFGLTDVNIQNVSKMFTEYVTNWAMGKLGNRYYLTKQSILYKLTELLLCQYELDLSREKLDFYDSPQKMLWNEVVEDKIITVVDSDEKVIKFMKLYVGSEIRPYYQTAGKLWSDKFSSEEQSSFYKQHTCLKKAMLKIVGNNGKITLLNIYKCLWFTERVPLLLEINTTENYDVILKILKFSNCKLKVIILTATKLMPTITNDTSGSFVALSDLKNEHRLKILNNSAKLQGRCVVLKELIDDSLLRQINCKVVINILLGNFNIGIEYEPLSEYFIKRSLLKIFMKIDVLERVQDEMFVIEINEETEDTSIRNKHNTLSSRYKTKPNIVFDGNISKQIEELKPRNEPIHRLIFHDENLLEWKESFGSTNQIQKYQFSHRTDFNKDASEMRSLSKDAKRLCNEIEDILASNNATNFFNDVNLVSASPGMGKSTLLDYVASTAPTKMWVLNVKLMDFEDHYDNTKSGKEMLTAQIHLKYFNDSILEKGNCSNKKLARVVFQKFLSAKQVLVMLDGFDEVSVSCKNEVMEITKCLHEAGFPIWLTTRPHLKTDLEERFSTISTTLRPFTVDDQERFLNRYFKHIGDTVDANKENHQTLIEEFAKKLLQASTYNLNDTDGEFMGIPLQTKLLAHAFSEELRHSLGTGICQFEHRFDLLHLYEEFMKRKENIFRNKFGKGAKDMKVLLQEHQQLFALKLVFSDYNLHRLNIDGQLNEYYKNNEDQIKFLQLDGVTVIQRNLIGTEQKFQIGFVHRTFAEYMAALWLLNNFNNERDEYRWTARFLLKKREMYAKYRFVFRMFDSMLARDYRLHLLIINDRLDEAQKLVKSEPEIMDEIDAGGRSFLHMLALYGVHRYSGYFTYASEIKDGMESFIEQIPKYKMINMKDKLGYSPMDYYAMLSNSSNDDTHSVYGNSKEITIETNIFRLRSMFIRCGINLEYKPIIETHLSLIIYQKLLADSYFANSETIQDVSLKLAGHYFNTREIIDNIRNESTIIELLQNIRSPTEPPYYYDLLFAAAFGTSRNVRDLISSESATYNQENFSNFNTPLYWAVKYNRLKIVKILLLCRENMNEFGTCIKDVTPLHCAAANGYTKIAKELLLNQADVNVQNDLGRTPLILALQNKHAGTAKLLLSNHGNVKLKDSFDCFPIYYAAENGLHDIVPDLIKDVDINHSNFDDKTPLDVAISNGHLRTVRLLLLNGANCNTPNSQNKLPLDTAAEAGFPKIYAEILLKTVNNDDNISSNYIVTNNSTSVIHEAANKTNIKDRTPLHMRIYRRWMDFNKPTKNHLKTRKFLHNNIQDTALHCLCRTCPFDKDGTETTVASLLDAGADVNLKNNEGQTPLHVFLRHLLSDDNSSCETVSLLADEHNLNIQDNHGNSPLHCLYLTDKSVKKSIESVDIFLLDKGADVNLKNYNGRTPMHVFLDNLPLEYNSTRLEIVSRLSTEDNVNIQNINGYTILHYLCRSCPLDKDDEKSVVILLLNNGADINLKNKYGQTPLNILLDNPFPQYNSTRLEIVSRLSSEDNVNIQDIDGNTALHVLCRIRPLDKDDEKSVVILLLNNGADINLRNKKGKTPLNILLYNEFTQYNSTRLEIVSRLSSEDNVNIQAIGGNTALHVLCRMRPLDKDDEKRVVILLLNKGADINLKNKIDQTPLNVLLDNEFTQYNSTRFEIVSRLSNKDNVNIQAIGGNTALHVLCRMRPLDKDDEKRVVILLLNKGADINLKNKIDQTPLNVLLDNEFTQYNSTRFEIVSRLSNKDNVNIQAIGGNTALHVLCRMRPLDKDDEKRVVILLLNKGADINLKNKYGQTPLNILLDNPFPQYNSTRLEIVSRLSSEDNVNIQDIDGNTALHVLCRIRPLDKDDEKSVVILLLNNGADINLRNKKGKTPLNILLYNEFTQYNSTRLEIVSRLSSEDNVNIQAIGGNTALHVLCRMRPLDKDDEKRVVILLLNKGADINLKNKIDQTPLNVLLDNEFTQYNSTRFEIVSRLSNKDNVNIQAIGGNTALHVLCRMRPLDKDDEKRVVILLLNKGADINLKNKIDQTPLNVLLDNEFTQYNSTRFEIVSRLSNKDNVNIQAIGGNTALHVLCRMRPLDKDDEKRVVILLLNKGADINLKNKIDQTPLNVLLDNEFTQYNSTRFEIVSRLSNKDNVNIQAIGGNTALHVLCRMRPLDKDDEKRVVILLLNKGADINLKNKIDQTPLNVLLDNEFTQYNSTRFEIVSRLSNKDNVNIQAIGGNTALHVLCRMRPLDKDDEKRVVILLLNKGADINLKNKIDQTPLNVLLDNEFTQYNSTRFEIVSRLSNKDNVNIQAIGGNTALHVLCRMRPLDKDDEKRVVILLLNKGADINLKNKIDQTPLNVLLDNEFTQYNSTRLEIVSRLSSEDNVNIQDIDGNTALHVLCRMRALDKDVEKRLVISLLNKGANINLKNKHGRTPLKVFKKSLRLGYNSPHCSEIISLLGG